MRLRVAFALLCAALGGGCGGGSDSPEAVVRAWSAAVNEGDNDDAGALFAEGAAVVQGGAVRRLATREDAIEWNAALPCSGRIVALKTRHEVVEVTFVLRDRGPTPCDGPGARVTAVLRVEDGKIVLWHQLDRPGERRRQPV